MSIFEIQVNFRLNFIIAPILGCNGLEAVEMSNRNVCMYDCSVEICRILEISFLYRVDLECNQFFYRVENLYIFAYEHIQPIVDKLMHDAAQSSSIFCM